MDILTIIENYIFVQGAILLFFAPFVAGYVICHKEAKFRHIPFNAFAENFLESDWANALVFFWAFGEAIAWFVIPEFLLLLVVFLRIKAKTKLLVYDLAGTATGTIVGLALARLFIVPILKIPYITQSMVEQVAAWYRTFGMLGLFFQPFSGVPYKVFVLTANFSMASLALFVLLAIAVRIGRYSIFYLLFESIYPFLHRFVSKNYVPIFLISCFVFSVLFLKVYHSYGGIFPTW